MSSTLPDTLEIRPSGPVQGLVRPPGSKSITNRALICAALAEGPSTLTGALESDDTQVMVESLRRLGLRVDWNRPTATIRISGNWPASTAQPTASGGRMPPDNAAPPTRPDKTSHPLDFYVGNSGTTVRFLTAMLTLGRGVFRLDGNARMRERPIQDLLDALRQLGADVSSELNTGCPPVLIRAQGLPGGEATVRGDISSQYLSALLMAAPYARRGVRLRIDGPLVSQPYVRITTAVMRAFGVEIHVGDLQAFDIHPGKYRGRTYAIEPDASAASYFFAAAAITGGQVTVAGLSPGSLQGDVAFVELLERMGCRVDHGPSGIAVQGGPLQGIDADMNAISDTVQTLAAVALFADGPTTITGVAHIRHKETDRIGNLAAELRRLGAAVEERPDGLSIAPGPLRGAAIDTYDDHRMAMSLALAGLRVSGVTINQPRCVAKTYPGFFDDLASITT
jgi:3-phosphoshikimate 1-carboxyvinyltransferase